jgi:hypothetical protein
MIEPERQETHDTPETALPPRHIGGQNLEGRFFIISVPAGWTQNDPFPEPGPDDRWFDRVTDFKAALDCPWIRRPVRFAQWRDPMKVVRLTRGAS